MILLAGWLEETGKNRGVEHVFRNNSLTVAAEKGIMSNYLVCVTTCENL